MQGPRLGPCGAVNAARTKPPPDEGLSDFNRAARAARRRPAAASARRWARVPPPRWPRPRRRVAPEQGDHRAVHGAGAGRQPCTSPAPKRAAASSESVWSTKPRRTRVTVSKLRWGCLGKARHCPALEHAPAVLALEVLAEDTGSSSDAAGAHGTSTRPEENQHSTGHQRHEHQQHAHQHCGGQPFPSWGRHRFLLNFTGAWRPAHLGGGVEGL